MIGSRTQYFPIISVIFGLFRNKSIKKYGNGIAIVSNFPNSVKNRPDKAIQQ